MDRARHIIAHLTVAEQEMESPAAHEMTAQACVASEKHMLPKAQDVVETYGTSRQVVTFIHGFDNSTDDADKRAEEIDHRLTKGKMQDAVLTTAFEWPSRDSLFKYEADEVAADHAIPILLQFVVELIDLGMPRVALVAHSMGNQIVVGLLLQIDVKYLPKLAIVSLAADVAVSDYQAAIDRVDGRVAMWTSYFCARDRALEGSFLINWFKDRAGRHVMKGKGVENIDCGRFAHLFWGTNHSYVDEPALQDDLRRLLVEKRPAFDRGLARHTAVGDQGEYWAFV